MKVHLSVLYSAIVILLVIQIVSFVSFSTQVSKVISEQDRIKDNFDSAIESLRQESEFSVRQLVDRVSKQKTDFDNEIELLKLSKQDFSEVIEDAIKSVVNVLTEKSSGSGFIIDSNGYVVTNAHVVSGASIIRIQTFNEEVYDAEVVGANILNDIALLKINGNFDALELADSSKAQIGEKVIAIGNPLGLSFTVTEGIVSAVKRTGPNGLSEYIQTDVTLNPGNSGSPLINTAGMVIGVNNFKVGDAESLGFALESNAVRKYINEIANYTLIN